MKYMRRTAEYTWTYHKTNSEFEKGLNITQVLDKIHDYKRKWKQHINLMPRNRLTRLIKTTPQRQKEPRKITEEISGCVRPELVNRWPNSLIAT
jgi:hypothetical protein